MAINTGFEMHDLALSPEFLNREPKLRMENREQLALNAIASKFSAPRESMLNELVHAAVDYCGADSAGISLEEDDGHGGLRFRWVAVAGSFEKYLGGTTPRNASPCGVCVDHWRPQHYKVTQPFYDSLGVTAENIRDGLLIPWQSDDERGTIWAVSHESDPAFDMSDYRVLQSLADLVSASIRFHTVSDAT